MTNNIVRSCFTFLLALGLLTLSGCASLSQTRTTHLYIASDSTATDYSTEPDYATKRYPQQGWGQVFQPLFTPESITRLKNLHVGSNVKVEPKAKGGRSTRSFFEEGRWREIYDALQPGDLVLIQFGHNDQSKDKVERYTPIDGYKQYLRLYVEQVRAKKARPILITSVNRNYPWVDGKLQNSHGDYPQAVKDIATEMKVDLIDLTQISIDHFTAKGEAYVTEKYFMNLPEGKFEGYPKGLKDNTHFQPEGAEAVAKLVFEALTKLPSKP
ncbi:MAG: rhamnogalacturonan acetylesterase [Cellvibrio sp.]